MARSPLWSSSAHPAAVFAARISSLLDGGAGGVQLIEARDAPGDRHGPRYIVAAADVADVAELSVQAHHTVVAVENRSAAVLATLAELSRYGLTGTAEPPGMCAWITEDGDLGPRQVALSLAPLPYVGHVTVDPGHTSGGAGVARVLLNVTGDVMLVPVRATRFGFYAARRRARLR